LPYAQSVVNRFRHPDDSARGDPDYKGPDRAGEPAATPESCTPPGGRLGLLLSCAGWQQDPWVDRLPRLLEPMGIIAHRAASGRQASEVIRTFTIHVAVVDLGLPLEDSNSEAVDPALQEGGPRLLELLSRLAVPPPVVAVKRGRTQRDDCRDMSAALRLGAFAVIDRPRNPSDMNTVLDVLRRCLLKHYQGKWPERIQ